MSNSLFNPRRCRFLLLFLPLLVVVCMLTASIANAQIVDENFSINNYPLQQIDPALGSSVTLSGTLAVAYNTSAGTAQVLAQGSTFTIKDALGTETGTFPATLVGTQGVYASAGSPLYVSGNQLMLQKGKFLELFNANALPTFSTASGGPAYISLEWIAGSYLEAATNAEYPGQVPSIVNSGPFSGSGQLGADDWAVGTLIPAANGVPEPASLVVWSLLGSMAVGLGWWRKRKVA